MGQAKVASVEEALIRSLDSYVDGLFSHEEPPAMKVAEMAPGTSALVAELEAESIRMKTASLATKVVGKAAKQVVGEVAGKAKAIYRKVIPTPAHALKREKELAELEQARGAAALARKTREAIELQSPGVIWKKTMSPDKQIGPAARAALVGGAATAPVAGAYIVTKDSKTSSIDADAIVVDLIHESGLRPDAATKVAAAGSEWIGVFAQVKEALDTDGRYYLTKGELEQLSDAYAKVATAVGIEITGSDVLGHVKEASIGGFLSAGWRAVKGTGKVIGGAARGAFRGAKAPVSGRGLTSLSVAGPVMGKTLGGLRGMVSGGRKAFSRLPVARRGKIKGFAREEQSKLTAFTGARKQHEAARATLAEKGGRENIEALSRAGAARTTAQSEFQAARGKTRSAVRSYKRQVPAGQLRPGAAAKKLGPAGAKGKSKAVGGAKAEESAAAETAAGASDKVRGKWPEWSGPAAVALGAGYMVGKEGSFENASSVLFAEGPSNLRFRGIAGVTRSPEKEAELGSMALGAGLVAGGALLAKGYRWARQAAPLAAKASKEVASKASKGVHAERAAASASKAGLSVSDPAMVEEAAKATAEAAGKAGLTGTEKAMVVGGAGAGGLVLARGSKKNRGPQIHVTNLGR